MHPDAMGPTGEVNLKSTVEDHRTARNTLLQHAANLRHRADVLEQLVQSISEDLSAEADAVLWQMISEWEEHQ